MEPKTNKIVNVSLLLSSDSGVQQYSDIQLGVDAPAEWGAVCRVKFEPMESQEVDPVGIIPPDGAMVAESEELWFIGVTMDQLLQLGTHLPSISIADWCTVPALKPRPVRSAERIGLTTTSPCSSLDYSVESSKKKKKKKKKKKVRQRIGFL